MIEGLNSIENDKLGCYYSEGSHNYIDPTRFEPVGKRSSKCYGPEGLRFPKETGDGRETTWHFSEHLNSDQSFRRINGWKIAHNGIIHGCHNRTLEDAFNQRMLVLAPSPKAPDGTTRTIAEVLEMDTIMAENQKKACEREHPVFDRLRTNFQFALLGWLGWYREAELHYKDPHPKRELRIQAWDELHADGSINEALLLRAQALGYKLKKDEYAKIGKCARVIGDLGVAASLQGFRLTGLMKNAMSDDDIVVGDMRFRFCKKPDTGQLRQIFEDLLNPPEKHFFVYFSDDSCYSRREADGSVNYYNVDISKCDASHRPCLFKKLKELTPVIAKEDMQILIDQLTADIEVRSYQGRHKVRLRSKVPRLYSGSTMTTLINNLANILVGLALCECEGSTGQELIDAVLAKSGYIVTLDVCEIPQHLQFLKNSPHYDINGKLQPLLNIGVLLRTSGVSKGDVPGRKGTIREKTSAFQASVLRGMYPRVHFPLIDNMKAQVDEPFELSARQQRYIERQVHSNLDYKATASEEMFFSSEEVYKRYMPTSSQQLAGEGGEMTTGSCDELDTIFGSKCGFGMEFRNIAAHEILQRDYGLGCY